MVFGDLACRSKKLWYGSTVLGVMLRFDSFDEELRDDLCSSGRGRKCKFKASAWAKTTKVAKFYRQASRLG